MNTNRCRSSTSTRIRESYSSSSIRTITLLICIIRSSIKRFNLHIRELFESTGMSYFTNYIFPSRILNRWFDWICKWLIIIIIRHSLSWIIQETSYILISLSLFYKRPYIKSRLKILNWLYESNLIRWISFNLLTFFKYITSSNS